MNPAAAIPESFSNRLRRLRTKIVAWFLADGLSRVLLCAVLVIGLDLLIDWMFHLDRPQRVVMLVLAIVAVAVVFYRRVVRPLSCRLSDNALCLQIEDRNEQLRQGLISAIQFARMDDFESRGTSPALVRETIDRAMRQTADVKFEGILRRDRFVVNVASWPSRRPCLSASASRPRQTTRWPSGSTATSCSAIGNGRRTYTLWFRVLRTAG